MHAAEAGVAQAARGPRLTRAWRSHLGRRLAMQSSDRHSASRAAGARGMSPRWMREIRGRARTGRDEAPCGRPRTADAERLRVRGLVAEERIRQGATAGWRPIHRALSAREPSISLMLVQQELAALKLEAG